MIRGFDAGIRTWVRARNRVISSSRRTFIGSGPCVSLTSYGSRIAGLSAVIESIGAGALLPSRFLVWLTASDMRKVHLLEDYKTFLGKGVEFLETPDYRSYKKYFSYAVSVRRHEFPLVTADDDVIYPLSWLRGLANAHRSAPDNVWAYRTLRIRTEGGAVAPYMRWGDGDGRANGFRSVAIGVSGVLMPPVLLDAIRDSSCDFTEIAPTADDLWSHRVALRIGVIVRQVSPRPRDFLGTGVLGGSLTDLNVRRGENDRQILRLYSADDIRRILTDPENPTPRRIR